MRSSENALRALRAQAQFGIVEAGAEVAVASSLSGRLHGQMIDLELRCKATAEEMRRIVQQPLIDLALLTAMRRLYEMEQRVFQDVVARLAAARNRESRARDALAALRHRER